MKKDISIGEKYAPAMEIKDQSAANAYFKELVTHCMSFGKTYQEAQSIERQNLGHYAGYYGEETRERVERLFNCSHPIFGSIANKSAPTAQQAIEIGRAMGIKAQKGAAK